MDEFSSFFKTVGGGEGNKCHYPTRLDTYGCGCQHDCKYCYAKSLLDFRKLWDAQHPSVVNTQKVHRIIERNLKAGDIVRLGGMTDCFQPLERKHRATYKTIEELNSHDIGYLIVTKSSMVADDEYLSLLRKDLAHIQITVTSTDDDYCREYEKAAPPQPKGCGNRETSDGGLRCIAPSFSLYSSVHRKGSARHGKDKLHQVRQNTGGVLTCEYMDKKMVRYRLFGLHVEARRLQAHADTKENPLFKTYYWIQGAYRM